MERGFDRREHDPEHVVAPDSSTVSSSSFPDVIAAVDLGSNSFHMIVARYEHGQIIVIDRLREMVRLAAGLDSENQLDKSVADRALGCLQRFGQRLRDMRAESVRVVGTNTLRRARRAEDFIARAQTALGHPIEIISGIEEARLIYLGAAHSLPKTSGRRLVVDIGGGSTELIIGEGTVAQRMESLYMGCVGVSERYFGDGKISTKRFDRARLFASLELEPVKSAFRTLGWGEAIGTSGTIRATEEILRELDSKSTGITRDGIDELISRMIKQKKVSAVNLPGLTSERAPVFPGGIAILAEIFEAMELDHMHSADGALREGLLYDLLGRLTDEDARVRSVRGLERRYHVDASQADRAEAMAKRLLYGLRTTWVLEAPLAEQVLCWAARLHEIGLDIAHAQYHRHGAYLLEHADLAGFPRDEQRLLACLVGSHRRRLMRQRIKSVPVVWQQKTLYLVVIVRLAVLLSRSRGPLDLPTIDLQPDEDSLRIGFPPGWLDNHPLTRADLAQETEWLADVGFTLKLKE